MRQERMDFWIFWAENSKSVTVSITISAFQVREAPKTDTHLLFPFSSSLLFLSFFFNQFEGKFFIDLGKFLKNIHGMLV